MILKAKRGLCTAFITAFALAAPLAASAVTLKITVTNTAGSGGPTLTPMFTGIHDGTFDPFTSGDMANGSVEALAEEGAVGGLQADIAGSGVSAIVTAPQGFGPAPLIEPGDSGFAYLDVTDTSHRWLSYMSMILPSNDQFIGNDDPFAYEIFDAAGTYLGDQTIAITGASAYDAGTEQNIGDGAPFQGAFGGAAQDEGGVIGAATGIDIFAGITLPNGATLDLNQINFTGNPDFQFATVRVEAVPVPAALPLMLGGLGLLGFAARRRKAAA